jgi:hypothetical protein
MEENVQEGMKAGFKGSSPIHLGRKASLSLLWGVTLNGWASAV